MILTLPNILTLFRLAAAPFVGFAFLIWPSPVADAVALVLFILAAVTDYLDGWLARRMGQVSAFGKMLDPIADKVMVVIVLTVLAALWQGEAVLMVPIIVILFREITVSGLREYLGARKDLLAVTRLAKWKTMLQMLAITVMLAAGIFASQLQNRYYTQDPGQFRAILAGDGPDPEGLRQVALLHETFYTGGLGLMWLAAILTLITGFDYFIKALPVLREDEK